jgi:hypothetical protein
MQVRFGYDAMARIDSQRKAQNTNRKNGAQQRLSAFSTVLQNVARASLVPALTRQGREAFPQFRSM